MHPLLSNMQLVIKVEGTQPVQLATDVIGRSNAVLMAVG
jgi:hypothetical protein